MSIKKEVTETITLTCDRCGFSKENKDTYRPESWSWAHFKYSERHSYITESYVYPKEDKFDLCPDCTEEAKAFFKLGGER